MYNRNGINTKGSVALCTDLINNDDISGFGKYNILHMLMSGIILLGMIMQSLALGYILPAAQCDLELTLPQRGWLSAIPFLGKQTVHIYECMNKYNLVLGYGVIKSELDYS